MLDVIRLSKSFRIPRSWGRKSAPTEGRARAGLLHAVRSVSFKAERGEILGVLGPNGAGKTTLLRLLSSALKPSSGTITLDGIDIVQRPGQVRAKLGFLSGSTGLYGRLTAREMIDYHARLHGLAGSRRADAVDRVITLLDIGSFADRRCEQLSTGMKQKVSIARTLVHDPPLVVMDEPTTGLDVAAAQTIVELVQRLRDERRTVLLSTHHMHEVDRLCDRVIVLRQGQKCFEGTVPLMRTQTGEERLEQALLHLLETTEASDAA
jgi:sodium transport system ATP-binding protein